MTTTVFRSTLAVLLGFAALACGETSGSVLERVPEGSPAPDDTPDDPPESEMRLDVFVVRDIATCAIGVPCDREQREGDRDCFELEDPNGAGIAFRRETVTFVPPDDPRVLMAEQAICFHLVIDDEQMATVSENFVELRRRVFDLSDGEILFDIEPHSIPTMTAGFERFENEGSMFLNPSALRPYAGELTRDTSFVFAVTGERDPASGLAPIVEHCVGTNREIEDGFAGAGYTWLTTDCDGRDSLLRHWLFQVTVALRDVNGFNDLYDRRYPPCRDQRDADPAEWWPNPDECSVDPDAPTCGDNRCEGTDGDFVGHVLTAHWPRGRDFVGNHCNNGRADLDYGETDVDVGGVCDLLGDP